MDLTEFARRARAHLLTLICWFIASSAIIMVCSSVSEWSERFRGWEADVVGGLFYLVGMFFGFLWVFFGVLIYGWIRTYPLAKRDAEGSRPDPERFRALYKEVIGPIPWK